MERVLVLDVCHKLDEFGKSFAVSIAMPSLPY